ncbi:MAG: archaellin/type IV pilin N-terminal domain-containing protein [Candidatus Bathyarchaeia archaeon]
MDRKLRSRKGISPILATLLLIVIAVAAVVVTYAWIMTYTGTVTGAANLGIMAIRKYNSTAYIIDVRNLGTANATVEKIRIAGSAGNTGWQSLPDGNMLISSGASRTLDTGNVGVNFSVGGTVTVSVRTTLPSEFSSKLTVEG